VAAWSRLEPAIDEQGVALLALARQQVRVVLVTNATTRLEQDLRRRGLLGLADAIVNSSRVGVAKPDPRIFQIAAARAGAIPARCLFADDSAAHVAAAQAAGMTAIRYTSHQDLARALAPLIG
jgi:putative hydrolase of the HAD superfamily